MEPIMTRCAFILKASCTDTVGIVAAVTGFIAARGGLITEMSHYPNYWCWRATCRS